MQNIRKIGKSFFSLYYLSHSGKIVYMLPLVNLSHSPHSFVTYSRAFLEKLVMFHILEEAIHAVGNKSEKLERKSYTKPQLRRDADNLRMFISQYILLERLRLKSSRVVE